MRIKLYSASWEPAATYWGFITLSLQWRLQFCFEPNIRMSVATTFCPQFSLNLTQCSRNSARREMFSSLRELCKHVYLYVCLCVCALVGTKLLHRRALWLEGTAVPKEELCGSAEHDTRIWTIDPRVHKCRATAAGTHFLFMFLFLWESVFQMMPRFIFYCILRAFGTRPLSDYVFDYDYRKK